MRKKSAHAPAFVQVRLIPESSLVTAHIISDQRFEQ